MFKNLKAIWALEVCLMPKLIVLLLRRMEAQKNFMDTQQSRHAPTSRQGGANDGTPNSHGCGTVEKEVS